MFRLRSRTDRELDASHPDVRYLLEYVADLERELHCARQELEACRRAAGARKGELLLTAIRRSIADRSGSP